MRQAMVSNSYLHSKCEVSIAGASIGGNSKSRNLRGGISSTLLCGREESAKRTKLNAGVVERSRANGIILQLY